MGEGWNCYMRCSYDIPGPGSGLQIDIHRNQVQSRARARNWAGRITAGTEGDNYELRKKISTASTVKNGEYRISNVELRISKYGFFSLRHSTFLVRYSLFVFFKKARKDNNGVRGKAKQVSWSLRAGLAVSCRDRHGLMLRGSRCRRSYRLLLCPEQHHPQHVCWSHPACFHQDGYREDRIYRYK